VVLCYSGKRENADLTCARQSKSKSEVYRYYLTTYSLTKLNRKMVSWFL